MRHWFLNPNLAYLPLGIPIARGYPENIFNSDYDFASSANMVRLAGFHNVADTEGMVQRMCGEFRTDRIIP